MRLSSGNIVTAFSPTPNATINIADLNEIFRNLDFLGEDYFGFCSYGVGSMFNFCLRFSHNWLFVDATPMSLEK
jgi:hypothetical protein